MTSQHREEFIAYLRACTDAQVQGVYEKERAARRQEYMELAVVEAARRQMVLDWPAKP